MNVANCVTKLDFGGTSEYAAVLNEASFAFSLASYHSNKLTCE